MSDELTHLPVLTRWLSRYPVQVPITPVRPKKLRTRQLTPFGVSTESIQQPARASAAGAEPAREADPAARGHVQIQCHVVGSALAM